MKRNWTALDHAAKLFVAGTNKTETQVFRFCCELYEDVNPQALQTALDKTIKLFPSYRMILRKGFFWYYLEESDLRPLVIPESKKLCENMKCTSTKKLLFEITYFKKRINIEVYHVLSDGSSAMNFFKMLIKTYLALVNEMDEPEIDFDSSFTQSEYDSYDHYYTGENYKRDKDKPACRIQGFKYHDNFLRNIAGQLPANEIAALAKSYGVTITILLSACIISAIGQNVKASEKKKPIVLSVPVDLRAFFPSASLRNFFGAIRISYQWKNDENNIEDIIAEIKPQFQSMLTKKYLSRQIDEQSHVEHNIFAKITPLFLKMITLKLVYRRAMKGVTATISNMGKVSLTPEYSSKIRSFEICASTDKLQFCVCSFENFLNIDCTNPHISSDIEKTFFRIFAEKGMKIFITSNYTEENK